jgi:hypothetical protein
MQKPGNLAFAYLFSRNFLGMLIKRDVIYAKKKPPLKSPEYREVPNISDSWVVLGRFLNEISTFSGAEVEKSDYVIPRYKYNLVICLPLGTARIILIKR